MSYLIDVCQQILKRLPVQWQNNELNVIQEHLLKEKFSYGIDVKDEFHSVVERSIVKISLKNHGIILEFRRYEPETRIVFTIPSDASLKEFIEVYELGIKTWKSLMKTESEGISEMLTAYLESGKKS